MAEERQGMSRRAIPGLVPRPGGAGKTVTRSQHTKVKFGFSHRDMGHWGDDLKPEVWTLTSC